MTIDRHKVAKKPSDFENDRQVSRRSFSGISAISGICS